MNLLLMIFIASIVDIVVPAERRISIGDSVDPEKYPYVVLVKMRSKRMPYSSAVCTGTLISRSVVLTAGHCVGEYEDFTFESIDFMKRAEFATKSYKKVNATGKFFAVIDPDDYFESNRYPFMRNVGLGYADIALFTLEDQLPICNRTDEHNFSIMELPIADVYSKNWTFMMDKITECTLLGYGAHRTGRADGQLRALKLSPRDHGNVLYAPLLTDDMQGRACCGDSGGPTICRVGDRGEHVIGVTSFSFSPIWGSSRHCFGEQDTMTYDVFVDIRKVLPIIQKGLKKLGKLEEFIEDHERCATFEDR